MACFLVPVAEAAIVTVVAYAIKSKEKNAPMQTHKDSSATGKETKISFSAKLKWLTHLLWGGAFLLAFEHVWHGEVIPYFPFLTAAGNPEDASVMLHEMTTVGVAMAVLVTLVWVGMVLVSHSLEKRTVQSEASVA